MSVSIEEVVSSAGYDVNNPDDANWILGQKTDWEELLEQAEKTVEEYIDYQDTIEILEEEGKDIPTFEEFRNGWEFYERP